MKLIAIVVSIVGIIVLAVVIFSLTPTNDGNGSNANEAPIDLVPQEPLRMNAVARAWMTAPGAIVCPDLATVSLLQELYAEHWGEAAQDVLTKGQSRLLRGPAVPAPDLSIYRCSLLPPGTPVQADFVAAGTAVVVTAKLPNGMVIHGVTNGIMLDRLGQPDLSTTAARRRRGLEEQERLSACVEQTQNRTAECVAESNNRREKQHLQDDKQDRFSACLELAQDETARQQCQSEFGDGER